MTALHILDSVLSCKRNARKKFLLNHWVTIFRDERHQVATVTNDRNSSNHLILKGFKF